MNHIWNDFDQCVRCSLNRIIYFDIKQYYTDPAYKLKLEEQRLSCEEIIIKNILE